MATAQKIEVWTPALEKSLVQGAKANTGQARTAFYQEFAAGLSSKPQWESVRAKYYAIMQAKGKPVGQPKPKKRAAKKTVAKPAARKQSAKLPSGLGGIKQQINKLETNVAAAAKAHQQAEQALADYRSSLASLVA